MQPSRIFVVIPNRRERAFSLIEMLVAVTVLACMTGVASYIATEQARQRELQAHMKLLSVVRQEVALRQSAPFAAATQREKQLKENPEFQGRPITLDFGFLEIDAENLIVPIVLSETSAGNSWGSEGTTEIQRMEYKLKKEDAVAVEVVASVDLGYRILTESQVFLKLNSGWGGLGEQE